MGYKLVIFAKMIRGSLNTMNYLEPIGFLNKIKAFFKRRHDADICVQYSIYNVRAFDIHVNFNASGKPYFEYDSIPYQTTSIYKMMNFLDKNNDVYVKVVLEGNSVKNEEQFYNYCSTIERIYQNIHFFGGYRKKDSKVIYEFNNGGIIPKINWYDKFF